MSEPHIELATTQLVFRPTSGISDEKKADLEASEVVDRTSVCLGVHRLLGDSPRPACSRAMSLRVQAPACTFSGKD